MKILRATLLLPIVLLAVGVTYVCTDMRFDLADLWRELKA